MKPYPMRSKEPDLPVMTRDDIRIYLVRNKYRKTPVSAMDAETRYHIAQLKEMEIPTSDFYENEDGQFIFRAYTREAVWFKVFGADFKMWVREQDIEV